MSATRALPIEVDHAERSGTLPDAARRVRLRRWRGFKDGTSRWVVGTGGISVIVALAFMFAYLFSEVFPLLQPASVERVAAYPAPAAGDAPMLVVGMDRYTEVGFGLDAAGGATFFRPGSGEVLERHALPLPAGVAVTAFAQGEPRTRLSALGLADGRAVIVEDAYDLTYPGGVQVVNPKLEFPFGDAPVVVDEEGMPIEVLGIQKGGRGTNIGAYTADGRLLVANYTVQRGLLGGGQTQHRVVDLGRPDFRPTQIMLSTDLRDMLVGDAEGRLHYFDIANLDDVRLRDSRRVTPEGVEVAAMAYLLGTVSVIVGGGDGSVSQWFLVRDEHNVRRLSHIRNFEAHRARVTSITPEFARKGFVTADAAGNVALHFATSGRSLLSEPVAPGRAVLWAIAAPRNNALFALDDTGELHLYDVSNRHPQVSWNALWGKVHYEGRSQPDYIWQSSSATDEFEPKFSLMPLTLGTVKAAFYAMLFAMPLAIMGAIYSAYFMSPRMRGFTKPSIEIMEALPTVILGFLAGLWFAPFVESHLPAVFSVLVLMPLAMLAASFAWSLLPAELRLRIPPGWDAAMLIPVVILVGWVCVSASPLIEIAFFSGDMRQWLTDVGITYDQRNAMVVGVAMGFAVIPTIYSIAEDAIFNVPKHLTQGSLALGATTWQTVVRVVLPTASPGIFSAVMIGLGRAVGETMIVLMATGNSPVMNFNIFEGMRTLSANIAVEMPEAEFGGTHFRILFLSALVLFMLTFVLNTIAEIVRQRLRRKYASI